MKSLTLVAILILSTTAQAQYNFWHTGLSGSSKGVPYSATITFPQVSNTSQTQTDVCLQASVSIKNVYGSSINRQTSMSFPITAGSGVSLYSDSGCSTSSSTLTVAAGSSQGTLYFKYTAATASASSISLNFSEFVPGKTVTSNLTFYRPLTCIDALNKGYMNSSGAVLTTGTYTIDVDGAGAVGPFTVYCNMSTSPAYNSQLRGATMVAMYNPNGGAINYVENLPTALGSGSNSTTLTDLKYQLLLNQSTYTWFLSSSAGVNILVPKSDMNRVNLNKNLSSTRPVAFLSNALKTATTTAPHNLWVHDSGTGSDGNYTGISFNASAAYLYRGSSNLTYTQPFFPWNGANFLRTEWNYNYMPLSKGASDVLYIWVY